MDSLTTHPSTAQQAKAFTSTSSLSFPGGAGDLTPPSEKDAYHANGQANGQHQLQGGNAASGNAQGNGVTPTTPAATPAPASAINAASGITPTLQ